MRIITAAAAAATDAVVVVSFTHNYPHHYIGSVANIAQICTFAVTMSSEMESGGVEGTGWSCTILIYRCVECPLGQT